MTRMCARCGAAPYGVTHVCPPPETRYHNTPSSYTAAPVPLFDLRAREAFRILQAMYEGALTPDEAIKEWQRVRGEPTS